MSQELVHMLLGKDSARSAVLRALFREPREWVGLRELARRTGFSAPMIAKVAAPLVRTRILLERREPNARLFRANTEGPLGSEMAALLASGRSARSGTQRAKSAGQPGSRPRTLAEAARLGHAHGMRDAMIREFCDEFYKGSRRARSAMIAAEPTRQDERADAYYAAVAEHLALESRIPIPRWALAKERFLHRPFFPAGLESLKATFLVESPVAFRRRMIFVGANPLSRPSRSLG